MPHISAHTAQAGALPKQWLHWAKLHGLRPESRLRKFRQIGLVGLGFRFRVNCHDKFQISCPLAEFDRWANSTAGEVEIPRTQDEFTKALARLIDGVKVKIHSRDLYFQQHTARPGMREVRDDDQLVELVIRCSPSPVLHLRPSLARLSKPGV